MDTFRQIIGKKIIDIYLEPLALESGIADTQIHPEFIYVNSGAAFFKTDNDLFLIGSIHTTKLGIDYLGIKERNVLLKESLTWHNTIQELNSFKNKVITSINLFYNYEGWTNYQHNEKCLDSLTINFDNGHSLSLFSGEFEIKEPNRELSFCAGRSSVMLFTSQDIFIKYKLNQASETITLD